MGTTIENVKILTECSRHGGNREYPDKDIVCIDCMLEDDTDEHKPTRQDSNWDMMV